jgi:hypothetical protein
VGSVSLDADSEVGVFPLLAGSSFAGFFSILGLGFGILLTLETFITKEHPLHCCIENLLTVVHMFIVCLHLLTLSCRSRTFVYTSSDVKAGGL